MLIRQKLLQDIKPSVDHLDVFVLKQDVHLCKTQLKFVKFLLVQRKKRVAFSFVGYDLSDLFRFQFFVEERYVIFDSLSRNQCQLRQPH